MAKTKISEFSTTAGNNTDINSINIAEGCAPSGINDAIRELMRQLKEFQTGGAGDSVNSGGDFSVATNKFTVASASGNTSVAGTLGVTGAATLSSTLAVTGTTTLTGALVANGNATLGDASGDTVTIKGTPTLEVNPTLSGGTANGVLYLNGSKVATSGSALTFDGTTLTATRGIAVNSSGTATSGFYDGVNISGYDALGWTGSSTLVFGGYRSTQWSGIAFYASGSEAMRLTSTGLGVGTSSPSYKLDVNGNAQVGNATAATNRSLFINGVVNKASRIVFQESGADRWLIGNGAASENGNFEIYDAVNGNNLIFNHSGNLGLGVTPSAWGSISRAMRVQSGISVFSNTSGLGGIGNNVYSNPGTGDYYIANGYATRYYQFNGTHVWDKAANNSSGAGASLTFTQAMTLDSSGSLLVGTTSNSRSARLRVDGDETAYFTGYGSGYGIGLWMTPNASSTGGNATAISLQNVSNTTVGTITTTASATAYNTSSDYRLKENIQDVTGSGAFIDALQPRTWNWKVDGSAGAGFIAHELQAVSPSSVTGTKDAVDADGNPDYQAVEYGSAEFIANIIAELQSLRARVAALES